jgi:hypothetical protein
MISNAERNGASRGGRAIVAATMLHGCFVKSIHRQTTLDRKGDMRAVAHGCSFSVNGNLDAEVKCAASIPEPALILRHRQYAEKRQNGIVEALRAPGVIRSDRDMVDHGYLRSGFIR